MKTTFTTLCLFINLLLLAQAPEIEWTKNYGGSGSDFMYGSTLIQQTTDGGYIMATSTTSNDGDVSENLGDADYWIVKLDEAGNIQWEKSYGGSGYDEPKGVQQTTDGGYIIIGYSNSTDGNISENNGGSDYWVIKLDESGDMEWERSYGGSDSEDGKIVRQTEDGGYIMAGTTISTDGDVVGNDNGFMGYWIIKTDETGNMEWQKFYGDYPISLIYDLIISSDGGYMVAGARSTAETWPYEPIEVWMLKLDTTGNLEWQQAFGGGFLDYAESVIETSDGGYLIAGYSYSDSIVGNDREADALILKLSQTGEVEWYKAYGGALYEVFNTVQETPDGGYICLGWSDSSDDDVSENFGMGDYWLVRLDSEGTLLWEKSFGGSQSDESYCDIVVTEDGGYILAGYSQSNDGDVPGNYGDYDVWVIKLSPENMGIGEIKEDNLYLYPNPTTGIINLQTKEAIQSVSVYNSVGQRVTLNPLNKENTAIDISNLSAGIYFVEVTLTDKEIKRYKVIKK